MIAPLEQHSSYSTVRSYPEQFIVEVAMDFGLDSWLLRTRMRLSRTARAEHDPLVQAREIVAIVLRTTIAQNIYLPTACQFEADGHGLIKGVRPPGIRRLEPPPASQLAPLSWAVIARFLGISAEGARLAAKRWQRRTGRPFLSLTAYRRMRAIHGAAS